MNCGKNSDVQFTVRTVLIVVAKLVSCVILSLTFVGCASSNKALHHLRSGAPARTVYVINHSILHTGIALQRSDLPPGTLPVSRDYQGSRYLEVGWGEDDGYRKPLSPRTAFHALRGSTRTVLLCNGFDAPASQRRAVVAIDLTERGFDRLTRHIAQTFALDAAGEPFRLEENWYRARGRYSALHNCNNWIAAGLRAAGCPINLTICITPRPLLLQVRQFGRDLPNRRALGRTSSAKLHLAFLESV